MTRKVLALLLAAALAALAASPALAERCGADAVRQPAKVVDVVVFKLVAGMTDNALLEVAVATRAVLCATDGFLRRTLSKATDGAWLAKGAWTRRDEVETAAEKAETRTDLHLFMAAAASNSVAVRSLDQRDRIARSALTPPSTGAGRSLPSNR